MAPVDLHSAAPSCAIQDQSAVQRAFVPLHPCRSIEVKHVHTAGIPGGAMSCLARHHASHHKVRHVLRIQNFGITSTRYSNVQKSTKSWKRGACPALRIHGLLSTKVFITSLPSNISPRRHGAFRVKLYFLNYVRGRECSLQTRTMDFCGSPDIAAQLKVPHLFYGAEMHIRGNVYYCELSGG